MIQELIKIQNELKAPKGQFNKFGNYKYRSCEDILEAVKPLLQKHNSYITISDDVINIGDRFYIKATVTFICGGQTISTTSFAREELVKKGMDGSQITGSASSYARKYALNGLLLIDDTKDSDSTNTHGKEQKEKQDFNDIEIFKKHIDGKSQIEIMEMVKKLKDKYKINNDMQEKINNLLNNIN